MAPESDHYSSESESDGELETWDDWTEEQQPAYSLFEPSKQLASPEAVLEHDKQVHGVDLALLASTLDFFERIRLINWIRKTKPDPKSLARLDRNADFLSSDDYLKPVIEDDALLQLDFDNLSLGAGPSGSSTGAPAPATAVSTTDSNDLADALRAQLADSNAAVDQLKRIIRERLGDSLGLEAVRNEDTTQDVSVGRGKGKASGEGQKEKPERDDDSHYFESYSYNEIHEIMIKDKIRTDSYRDFILNNPSIFRDAVVLDVGCGSGILSMFAAQAGARKVYAVDASAVAFKAERNIKANGFSEVISVIKGKVEDITLPEKVDIIVSEWMGYFLLYECMLDSVLSARDRFLKPSGLMVPSQTSIMLSLFEGQKIQDSRITFWEDVYGFKMEAMREEIYDEAVIDVVDEKEVASGFVSLSDIVTGKATVPDLSFTTPFQLVATRPTTIRSFLGHFDTFFTSDGRLAEPTLGAKALNAEGGGEVFFTTGPQGTPTHWKQTVFLLKKPFKVQQGTTVKGSFTCSKNPDNSRELVVEVTWRVDAPGQGQSQGEQGPTEAQVWKVR